MGNTITDEVTTSDCMTLCFLDIDVLQDSVAT